MKITCNSCQSKYTVSDEKVQGKTVKIKCRKCGATILVNSSGATTTNASDPAVAAADAAAAAAGDGPTYLVNVAEGDQRSMSLQELVQAVNSSTITRETYVWADGMADWQPIGQVQTIVDSLGAGGAAAAAEPARPAAKREGGRGASRDLFGGEAPADGGGLFGVPGKAAAVPAPRIGAGIEEQSALFSLSALTSRVAQSPVGGGGNSGPSLSALASSSSSSKPLNTEDSGLIDLKALAASVAAKPEAASSGPNLLDDPGGLFQMSGPPMTTVTAAPTVSTAEPEKKKNRTPLFIGIGAVVAISAIVGAFMFMAGGPPPPDPATQPQATPVNTPPPLDTAPPTAAPPPTEVPTTSPSAVAVTPKTPVKGTGGGSKTGSKAGPATGTGPTTTTPPVKTGGSSKCGCAPSDLMCNMKCSAKK